MHSTLLAKARLGACRRWPAATAAILSLIPVERKGLGTMAVDKHWRLYFDPDYLAAASNDEAELVILHEVSHLLLKHHERGSSVADWELWNWASDCSINFRLQAEGHAVPPEWLLPARLQLPPNQTAEQYYRQLTDQKSQQKCPESDARETGDVESSESSQQTEDAPDGPQFDPVKPGTSGSCSDGRQRPWEEPVPADQLDDSVPPAMPKHEQEQVLRDVAERIAKQAGTGAGSWSRWARDILSPRIDPKTLLIAAVRQAVEQTAGGHDDQSYRRPSRRPSFAGAIRPGSVALVPRVLVIVDSSGSMGEQDLGLALG
jgi:predicted metal-dependent peptidase